MITKEVFVARVRDFLGEIARLNKKAARIGVAPIQFEDLGKVTRTRTSVVVDEDGNEDVRTYPVDCQQYRITVSEPADCPWVPLVKITPDGEGNAFAEALGAATPDDAKRWKDADALNPLVYEGQKLIPSVTRVFSRSKELFVFLQAYERTETTAQPLVAFVTFYRGGVKALETSPLPVTAAADPHTKALPLRFGVPLEQLTPGRYDCQISVLEPGTSKASFWRAPIAIVP